MMMKKEGEKRELELEGAIKDAKIFFLATFFVDIEIKKMYS